MDNIDKLKGLTAQAVSNETADLELGQEATDASKLDFSAAYTQSRKTIAVDQAAAELDEEENSPTGLETANAVFNQYNPITSSIVRRTGNDLSYELDTNFDATSYALKDEFNDISYNDKQSLVRAFNEEHAQDIVSQIRMEMHDRDVIDRSSLLVSAPLMIAAELGNPANYIPFVGQAASGASKLNSAVRIGLSAMGQTALSETSLHNSQLTRSADETMIALAGSLVLAGGLEYGLAAARAKKINKEVLDAASDRVKADRLYNDGGVYRNVPDADINSQARTVLAEVAQETDTSVKDVVKSMRTQYGFDMTPETAGMIQLAERNSDYYNRVAKESRNWFTKMMPRTDFHQMMDIDSPLGKKLGVDFFEAASGHGGNLAAPSTASLKKDMYADHLTAQFVPDYARAYTEYAKDFSATARVKDGVYGNDIRQAFDTDLSDYLAKQYSNSRFGTDYDLTANPAVTKAANAWNKQMKQGLQLAKDKNVAGFEGTQFHNGYVPLRVDQSKLRARFGTGGQLSELRKSISSNLMSNSPGFKKLIDAGREDEAIKMAESIASNYTSRLQNAAVGVDQQSMDGLLGLVARKELVEDLKGIGVGDDTIEELLDGINVRRADTGTGGTMRESHTRLPLDLHGTYDGVRLNDILQNNMESISVRYNATLGGRSALAEKGYRTNQDLTNAINTVKQTAGTQLTERQLAILDDLPNYMSSTPVNGSSNKIIQGFQEYGTARSLGGTGLASIPELGMLASAHGIKSLLSTVVFKQIAKDFNVTTPHGKEFLGNLNQEVRELAWGSLAMEHKVHRPRVRLDEQASDGTDFISNVNAQANKALGYASFNNSIRSSTQDQVVAQSGVDLYKLANGGKATRWLSGNRPNDLGWDETMFKSILANVKKHAVDTPNGVRFNFDKWDNNPMVKGKRMSAADAYFDGIYRHGKRVVQSQLAGEGMHAIQSPIGRMLTQFMNYPITALHKQLGRHLMHADKEALMIGIYSSMLGVVQHYARTAITTMGKEESERSAYWKEQTSPEYLSRGILNYHPLTPFAGDLMNVGANAARGRAPDVTDRLAFFASIQALSDATLGNAAAIGQGDWDKAMLNTYNAAHLSTIPYAKAMAHGLINNQ